MPTVEAARGGPRPAITIRPAPGTEPPFDDEAGPQPWAAIVAGQLALDWDLPAAVPSGTPSPPPAVVAGPTPQARTAVRRFVAALVEVLNGYRPPAHLRDLCRPVDAAGIVAQARAAQHRMAEFRRGSARRSATAGRHGRNPDPVAVIRANLCTPTRSAVEAAVLLVTGPRTWALALRLEWHEETWTATVIRLI